MPLEAVSAYIQKRALAIYDRAYGGIKGNKIKPEKPRSKIITDDARMVMHDLCVNPIASPRPPAPVYRGRTESFNDDNAVLSKKGDPIRNPSPPSACWFEWTVFDCAHGEQMMVPKYLQIILEKTLERSEY